MGYLPFPPCCRAPWVRNAAGKVWLPAWEWALGSNLPRCFFGSSFHLPGPVCRPAQFSRTLLAVLLANQSFWCCYSPVKIAMCPVPLCEARSRAGSGDGQCSSLLPQQSLIFAVRAVLLPAFGAFLQTKPKIVFHHVLHTGVVGQTWQLHSLFHVFTCLD